MAGSIATVPSRLETPGALPCDLSVTAGHSNTLVTIAKELMAQDLWAGHFATNFATF